MTIIKSMLAAVTTWLALHTGALHASTVAYEMTGGLLFNLVGPVYTGPQFIGDRFAVSTTGWLDTIALPLAKLFDDRDAVGTVTLWSDDAGTVGSLLFSAGVTAPNAEVSNSVLPPFFTVTATQSDTVLMSSDRYYWLTLSALPGSADFIFFSNVDSASAGTVYFFDGIEAAQYSTGLQAMVVRLTVNPIPEPNTYAMLLTGLVVTGVSYKRKRLARISDQNNAV
jgi:hypothetical protein